MPYFDRFDICEAYYALETDWNQGGVLHERTTFQGPKQVTAQLHRMGFKPGLMFNGYESLSDNGKEIYDAFVVEHRMCSGCDGACVDAHGVTCDMLLAECECALDAGENCNACEKVSAIAREARRE